MYSAILIPCPGNILIPLGYVLLFPSLALSSQLAFMKATRWDNYLHIFDERIHWFSLTNSIVIVIFLCFMVSMILLRTVNRDVRSSLVFDLFYFWQQLRTYYSFLQISRYNAMDISEDVQEDFGWKLVHGEVFRSPRWPMALSVLVGNGSQLVAMTGITLGMCTCK